jgi:Tfp pilus assembly protein PilV
MSGSICSNRGISLTEVIVAILVASVGIVSLLAVQPQSWNLAGRSDSLGRAAGILQSEMSLNEATIMNPDLAIPQGQVRTIYVSRQAYKQSGDAVYTVNTQVEAVGTAAWRVRVIVTWPSNTSGISDSLIVTRQEGYRVSS